MPNSEGSFVIKRSWKFLASVAMIGFVIAAFGECFLYCNSVAADIFCKWCGIIATIMGAAMICWPVSHITAPLLKADYVGIWFDIAVSGNGVFIPWDEIANIKVENFGMLSFKWKTTTPCLVFEINDNFSKRIPALLKSAYYRSNSRLYFASGILSVPADEALRRLLSFQKGGG